MANLFSYPFRVNPDGTVAKSPEDENYYAQELINMILTSPGERDLVPDYGISDPVFDRLNTVELLGKIEMFGPPVKLEGDNVVVTWPRDGQMNIDINYSRADTDDDDQMINDGLDDDDGDYDDEDTEPNINDYFGFNERTDY